MSTLRQRRIQARRFVQGFGRITGRNISTETGVNLFVRSRRMAMAQDAYAHAKEWGTWRQGTKA